MKKTFIRIAWAVALALPALTFTACNDDDPIVLSDEADILSVTFKDQSVVQSGPTRDGDATPTRFVFYVRHDADDDIKALVPTIEISEGATISPKSDEPQDFSAKSSIRYTVTAEDGVIKVPYDIVCEKLPDTEAYVISVEIEEESIVSEQPVFEPGATSATFKLKPGTTLEQRAALTPTINFHAASIDPESGITQDFTSGSVTYTLTAENGTEYKFTLNCVQEQFTGATIDKITFDSDIVVEQPVISGDQIEFYVSEDATPEQIATLIPSITISEGATITPAIGEAPGFVVGEPIEYTVTPEDGEENKYTVICKQYEFVYYDFNSWDVITVGVFTKYYYDLEKEWCNANSGVASAITLNMVKNKIFPTKKTDITPLGGDENYAAEMKSNVMQSTGTPPNLVAGNLYLGGFYLGSDILKPLNATKFGIPFYNKPIKVKGMFKYTPGDPNNFYNNFNKSPEPEYDSFAMTAVLYEVEDHGEYVVNEGIGSYKNNNYGNTLTGYEMLVIDQEETQEKNKVVALKQWTSTEAYPEFTPFELELKYLQEYDSNKKYKFSIIFSSSKDGANYNGAEGSTLIIDDVYVIYK